MPLYEWQCECGHVESVFASVADRDGFRPEHNCGQRMHRNVGGRGMLYFEEGRARPSESLGGQPITSLAQHRRILRQRGLAEAGDVPASVRANPKTVAMQRYLEKDRKGRWF